MTICFKNVGFGDGVLRHDDGSINIAAYGSIARGQRVAALDEAVRSVYRSVASAIAGRRHDRKHSLLRNASPTGC